MARGHSRIHRLPQRLDYTLIPAPLDLSLPLVDEKSPLPAIIVTPSSPASANDFSIAFLAPPPKPTIRQRLISLLPKSLFSSHVALPQTPKPLSLTFSAPVKARTIVTTLLLLAIMACHVVLHRMAIQGPRMDFGNPGLGLGEHSAADLGLVQEHSVRASDPGLLGSWLLFWKTDDMERTLDFVITERTEKSKVSADTTSTPTG